MSGLCTLRMLFPAGSQSLLVAHIGKLLKPVGTQLIQVVGKHLRIVWNHIVGSDCIAQLPSDPVHELHGLRLAHIAACLSNRIQISLLKILRKLPYIGFKGMMQLIGLSLAGT